MTEARQEATEQNRGLAEGDAPTLIETDMRREK